MKQQIEMGERNEGNRLAIRGTIGVKKASYGVIGVKWEKNRANSLM